MNPYKSNNIILIIGNGFDLAHGLKTSYNDFANWFITKIEEEITTYLTTRNNPDFFNEKFIDYFYHKTLAYYENQQEEILNALKNYLSDYSGRYKSWHEILTSNTNKIKIIIPNEFLGKLYTNKYKNWFDIENAYFQELVGIKRRFKSGYISGEQGDVMRQKELEKLNQLNKELIEIKNYLKEYLETIKPSYSREVKTFFDYNLQGEHKKNLYIVNFNYTNTVRDYITGFDGDNPYIKNVNTNYIHGNLKQDNIIFGYGNDRHKEYQEIKDLEINEFLENFKTFEYLKNNNYSRIYDDILDNNSIDDYIVFVLGHSLGATDKTLLEEIFNNEKCKQIHLFKRRDLENDEGKLKKYFNDLVFSASRILTNEKDLRKKILNYENSEFFP